MVIEKPKLVIRPITSEFYEANLNLMNSVIKESHFLARKEAITPEESMQFMKTFLIHPSTIYLIALYENEIIGHITALPRFEDLLGHVVNIGYLVHRAYRGKGIGARLMESLISEAKKRERIKILVAEVAEDNTLSIKLLTKFNFKEFGRLPQGMMKKAGSFVDLLYFARNL